MVKPPIILASSSPYRRQILDRLGLNYESIAPNIDEKPISGETARKLASRLAQEKAQAIACHYHQHLIIGSDQTASLNGQRINKPGNFVNAKQQLGLCSGKSLTFYTGLCLINSRTGTVRETVDDYTVHFRTLTPSQIERYLLKEQPYDCAGSFKLEGLGISLFERLSGGDPNTLIGLPTIKLIQFLELENIIIP